jgi:tetratricopeptide (TPR) repeat protein
VSSRASSGCRHKLQAVCSLPLLTVAVTYIYGQIPVTAVADARAGRVDTAISELNAAPKNAETHALLCSLYASVEHRDQAISECEAAAKTAPQNSTYQLRLARVYGDKANHAGMITGMQLVGKIRDSFQQAVQLDGRNVEALSDLGQFYVDAPGVVGGGMDKAQALVERLKPLSQARAHRLAGMIAAEKNDDATAINEFNAEIATSHSAEAYYDLANFYRSRKQYDRAAQNAKQAIVADTLHGADTVDAAAMLIDMKRELPAAQTGLKGYLGATLSDDVASYARAHTLLGHALDASGDGTGAQHEYAAALALAHDYEPARKALKP